MKLKILNEIRDFYLDILNPDRKLIMRLNAAQIDSKEILPLIKEVHSKMRRMYGSEITISELVQLFIQVKCKGYFSNEEFLRLHYHGINLIIHLKMKDDPNYSNSINKIQSEDVSFYEFLNAIKSYLI